MLRSPRNMSMNAGLLLDTSCDVIMKEGGEGEETHIVGDEGQTLHETEQLKRALGGTETMARQHANTGGA